MIFSSSNRLTSMTWSNSRLFKRKLTTIFENKSGGGKTNYFSFKSSTVVFIRHFAGLQSNIDKELVQQEEFIWVMIIYTALQKFGNALDNFGMNPF